jgi:hypothetical protein
MSSRAWILILTMGLVGFCLMGLLTKYAIDSSPELKRMIEFKAALASEFEDRGVEEVAMRKLPARGYHVLLTIGPGAQRESSERLDLDVARYFAAKFPDRTVFALEVERAGRPSFGCGTVESQGKRQFSLSAVRAGVAEEDRRKKLDEQVSLAAGFRVVAFERQGSKIRVVAESPGGFAGDLKDAIGKMEPAVRAVQGGRYSSLQIRVRRAGTSPASPPAEDAAGPREVEATFDPTGREIETPSAPGRP